MVDHVHLHQAQTSIKRGYAIILFACTHTAMTYINLLLLFFLWITYSLGALLSQDCFDHGLDYVGNDISDGHHHVPTSSAEDCQRECQNNDKCNFWTWEP